MNWVDYTIVGVLALSVLVGLWRGLVSEVLAVAVWLAAFWVAWLLGDRVADLFIGHVGLRSARMVLGYGLCFVAVLMAGALLRLVLHKLVAGTGLSGSDRLLGMLFGLARGALLVTLAVLLIGFTPFPGDAWWHQSRLLPSFQSAAVWLGTRLPQGVEQYLSYAPVVRSVFPPGSAPIASRGQPAIPAAASSADSPE